MLEAQAAKDGSAVSAVNPMDEWIFAKPLQALHIGVLREYLENEFSCLAGHVPFGYDFERIIDDFVFLCFFVGKEVLEHKSEQRIFSCDMLSVLSYFHARELVDKFETMPSICERVRQRLPSPPSILGHSRWRHRLLASIVQGASPLTR